MVTTLTDSKLRAMTAPIEGRVEHLDDKVLGLRVRVSCKGTKTFILRKRNGTKVHNVTLGKYGPRFGLAEARRKARALLNDLEAGKSLPPVGISGARSNTIRALAPTYLKSKEHLRSHREIKRVMDRHIVPELGDRIADAVTRGEVTKFIDSIAEQSPVMARAVHAHLSAFYTWAMPRLDGLPANPCRDAGRPAKPKDRDRVLSDAELVGLWQVSDEEEQPWGAALKLLLLTGARRDEVFNADQAEFDLEAAEWVIPGARTKNGKDHIIPLSTRAMAVVKAIPKSDQSKKLFPAEGNPENGPSGFSKAQARFRTSLDKKLARTSCEDWRLHDIRRTVATGLQRLEVRFEVTEAVLNHVSGARAGIAGVYQRHDWKAEKRVALQAWADHLSKLIASSKRKSALRNRK